MSNTPIIEEVNAGAPVALPAGLDLSAQPRPAATQPYQTGVSYAQDNLPGLEQLPTFIQTVWKTTLEEMSHTTKIVVKIMTDYISKMGPASSLTPPEKAKQQTQFYKAIIHALNAEPDQSLIAMRIIMFLINAYKKTVFNDRIVLEASDMTSFTREEHKCFRSLVMLFIATADPITRKHALARQVDLTKVKNTLQTSKLQDNLVRFYSIY